ncbi:MAG: DNA mismatch repair protein MutS [Myxococcota bacterium]
MSTGRRTNTPMMQQYLRLKRQASDALLLFRLGDFYELFLEDAELAAPLLDLVLTTRDRDADDPVPMCGIPAHAAETYVRRLLAAGHAVAIADQVEDPQQAKGLVRREIVEVATPGLVVKSERLEGTAANYLAAVLTEGERRGLAFVDVSTGEFAAADVSAPGVLEAELDRIDPREIVARDAEKGLPERVRVRWVPDQSFEPARAAERVGRLPDGLDPESDDPASRAAAAIWSTVADLQPTALAQIDRLRRYRASERLLLDGTTRRHLELFRNLRDGSVQATLLEVVDRTRTPMGHRELVRRLGEPLMDPGAIAERLDQVERWLEPDSERRRLASALKRVGDLERQIVRAALPSAGPRELAALRNGLAGLPAVHAISPLSETLDDLREDLERVLVDDPPPPPRGEPYTGYIRDGVDRELDDQRAATDRGQTFLGELEVRERDRTGITNLRVRYHRVFGYLIEVPRSQLARVPSDYRRKQTTRATERHTTDELERFEGAILRARDSAAALESRLLADLRDRVTQASTRGRCVAIEVAGLDVSQSLATLAREQDYVRPEVDRSLRIEIEGGRHPVVERFTPEGFVPNDVTLDAEDAQLIVLTGPNMAGKSTLLRQVALILLLAQMGSFVPARRARIGIADRIFTRVGASDSLVTGQSTFMVEMAETAAILREATPRSLILLDEIGRGTSTFDGLSIAWAVAEHLHDTPGLRSRTLFATHYHELADLARTRPRVRNFHFACTEQGDEVVFLRRMEPGAASRSYGIEVARRAGLPPPVLQRARDVLVNLEGGEFDERGRPRLARPPGDSPAAQLPLFDPPPDALRDALRNLDTDRMTPIDALNELSRLRKQIEEEEA